MALDNAGAIKASATLLGLLEAPGEERVGGERVGAEERRLDLLDAHELLGVVGRAAGRLPGEQLEHRAE